MCGIVGYVGDAETGDDALSLLINGLERLEYRGYDSAGVCLRTDPLTVYKKAGEVSELKSIVPESSDTTCGVGHTRWSTHGEPTDENAHPHTDAEGRYGVVHNGIIENYDTLRDELEEKGYEFTSETDTEVVPHLLADAEGDLLERLTEVTERLEGSYALACVSSKNDEVVVARQDSPLVVGHGDDTNYIGSDVTAFVEHTRDVSYLHDGDVARVTAEGVEVWNGGERVERDVETVDWDVDAAEKGGYDHYMLKEIHEQPRSLRQTVSERADEVKGEATLDLPDRVLARHGRAEFVACGTSYHAAVYAQRLFEEHADVPATVEYASEYDGPHAPGETLVVAVTQSGETADTLSAMRRAGREGATTLAVTNTVGSTAAREADENVYIRAGPEIGVAATKTFASQVVTLGLVAVAVGRARGTLPAAEASSLLSDLRRVPGAVQRVLDDEENVKVTAEEYAHEDAFFYIGRRLGYPVALEGALKLKEISYDHAEGFPAGELKHGPLALVTPNTPVIAVATEGTRPKETLNNVKEVESRGAPVVAVTSSDEVAELADVAFRVPSLGEMEPLLANVYLQLFAYHVARLKDRPIDKPRNLAKSVTVE
ncbi:MAG: glutamine--fructose-6-phosphate transaminase (isomerizing) [Halobacteriales archaeon]|nr:glutamine--fructose-6-phosphate transaminase (isomerizing) [Halobacteriales archaeon]